MITLTKWYQNGFRRLMAVLRLNGIGALGKRRLSSSAAYCRMRYIDAMRAQYGDEVTARRMDMEGSEDENQ